MKTIFVYCMFFYNTDTFKFYKEKIGDSLIFNNEIYFILIEKNRML